jgi:hypothetical protein
MTIMKKREKVAKRGMVTNQDEPKVVAVESNLSDHLRYASHLDDHTYDDSQTHQQCVYQKKWPFRRRHTISFWVEHPISFLFLLDCSLDRSKLVVD